MAGLDPRQVISHFRKGTRQETAQYKSSINLQNRIQPGNAPISYPRSCIAFVAKYFGNGIRPIVWFDEEYADQLLILLLQSLWPRLRQSFAACTFSLQLRALSTRPFDLLFAPSEAYSRFANLPRENLLQGSEINIPSSSNVEPWCEAFAKSVFSASIVDKPGQAWPGLMAALDEDPTAVRRLYLLNELRERVELSPTAALGMMDIVESLSPKASESRSLKASVLNLALEQVSDRRDAQASVELAHLICERLTHPAFESVAVDIQERIIDVVSRSTAAHPDIGLAGLETLIGKASKHSTAVHAFRRGLVQALNILSAEAPARLAVLRDHPTAAADLVNADPGIAGIYLKLATDRGQAGSDVLRWLKTFPDDVNWPATIKALLPLTYRAADASLADELFVHLAEEEVQWAMTTLTSTNALEDEKMCRVVEARLIGRFPTIVRDWAFGQETWTQAIAEVAAATFPDGADGVLALLADQRAQCCNGTRALAELIRRDFRPNVPNWLRHLAETNSQVLLRLLNCGPKSPERVLECIGKLCQSIDSLSEDAVIEAKGPLLAFTSVPIFDELTDLVVRSSIAAVLRTESNWSKFEFVTEVPISAWFDRVHGARLVSIVANEVRRDADSWQRAWQWLSGAPFQLLHSHTAPTLEVIGYLVSQRRGLWTSDAAASWAAFLHRSVRESQPVLGVRHCVQALEFAFRNTDLPLAKVVTAAFPVVYGVVVSGSLHVGETDRLFSYFDWDRGKELRRMLVDAFLQSSWDPGELALCANSAAIVRQIYKRVSRKWRGREYVDKMVIGLGNMHDDNAVGVKNELIALINAPDFYEPWD
jgi:hypothetical protein